MQPGNKRTGHSRKIVRVSGIHVSRAGTMTDCPHSKELDQPPCFNRQFLPVVGEDPSLACCAEEIAARFRLYHKTRMDIHQSYGSLEEFSLGHTFFGFTKNDDGIFFREWLPSAKAANLIGEFNNWDRRSHPLSSIGDGIFFIFLPKLPCGKHAIQHNSKVKLHIHPASGDSFDRIPAYIRKTTQDYGKPYLDGVYWDPAIPFRWTCSPPVGIRSFRIYEAHGGINFRI